MKEKVMPDKNKTIIEMITRERLKRPEFVAKRETLFKEFLDNLNGLAPDNRLKTLGGYKPGSDVKTKLSPKKWADIRTVEELTNEIQAAISDEDIGNYIRMRESEAREKGFKQIESEYSRITNELGYPSTPNVANSFAMAEQQMRDISTAPMTNTREIRKTLVRAKYTGYPVNLIYIKCARFAYPEGELTIIPNLEDYSYKDKNGNAIVRNGSQVDTWFTNTMSLSQKLNNLEISASPIVAYADTDLTDVRGLRPNDQRVINSNLFLKELRRRYSNIKIISFSDLTTELNIESQYDKIFFGTAKWLLRNSGPQTLNDYGLTDEYIYQINQAEEICVPISPLTFERAVREEMSSQLKSLPEKKCTFSLITVNTALRIARDIAQVGVIMPAIPNSIYVSDRSLKAVDFGFIGNKLTKTRQQPVVFQKYED